MQISEASSCVKTTQIDGRLMKSEESIKWGEDGIETTTNEVMW